MTEEQFLQETKDHDVIILQGIPGSGKSTLAKKIRKKVQGNNQIFSADDGMMFQGKYLFQPEKLGRCHQECFRSFLAYLEDTDLDFNTSVAIIDNTNTSNLEIAPYMAAAQAYGRRCYIVSLNAPAGRAILRQIHGVPTSKIYSMHQRIQNSKKNMPAYWSRYEIEE
jgi:predicted kinase